MTLQCDASDTGLGAPLTQEGKPVRCACRALAMTESGYAQMEKECLAIIFGMEKLHYYAYGRKSSVRPWETQAFGNNHQKATVKCS